MQVMTSSSNGESIFKRRLAEALLEEIGFPFDGEGSTPDDKLPPLPQLNEQEPVAHRRAAKPRCRFLRSAKTSC
jgi:hypothetical protein